MILPDESFYIFKYNKAGLMTESTDPEGNKTNYFYDKVTGNLVGIRDSLGNGVDFKLDGAGNIIEVRDGEGESRKSGV